MNMETDAVLQERPVVSTVVVALVATVAYAGVQLVVDGSIAVAETASFVLVFTLIYVAGARYLRNRSDEEVDASLSDESAE